MNNNILFSVVIPTYHRNDLLAKCLDCLAPNLQTLASDQYEVIVSDDGHESTAEDMIRQNYPWVKWIAGPRKGPAANRNNGAKYAQGEWLVFTDDDCLPDPQWLIAYGQGSKGTALALEGAIYPLGNLNQDLAECPVNLTGGCFWSANIAVKRLLFEEIGGFDPNYFIAAHEDQDLKIRIDKFGKIDFIPEAKVYHPIRLVNLKKLIGNIPKQTANWAYHVNKHQIVIESGGKFKFVIKGYKFYLLFVLVNLYRLKFNKAFYGFVYLIWGLPLSLFYIFQIYQRDCINAYHK